MKEVKYYISDDGKFRADNPEEVIKYEEETEKQLKEELQKLSEFYCVLSPDFSLFTNMPRALQIESVFKNRWCGAFWQSKGLKVIPTVSWSDEKSFDFCFEGMPDKNNTNLAKTPLFTRFFANSLSMY